MSQYLWDHGNHVTSSYLHCEIIWLSMAVLLNVFDLLDMQTFIFLSWGLESNIIATLSDHRHWQYRFTSELYFNHMNIVYV